MLASQNRKKEKKTDRKKSKSAVKRFKPLVIYSTVRSEAVVPVLVLLFVVLWFIL